MSDPRPSEHILTIHLEIDEEPVVGEVLFRTKRDVSIRILKPYKNLSNSRHIPHFAPGHVTFDGPRGDSAARALLLDTFALCRFLESHLVELREAWAAQLAAGAENPPIHFERDEFLKRRKTLRVALKKGEVSPATYQAEITRMKRLNVDYEAERAFKARAFLAKNLPERLLNVDLESQALVVIEGRLQFLAEP